MLSTAFSAHCSSVLPLQFESVLPIDSVASRMIAILYGCVCPFGSAVAIAPTVSVWTPKSCIKVVGTAAVSFTLTAFASLFQFEAPHDDTPTNCVPRQGVVTVVKTLPMFGL